MKHVALAFLSATLLACPAGPGRAWVASWGTSPQDTDEPEHIRGATIREFARLSLGGRRLRLRLSNAFGTAAVAIGSAHLALSEPRVRWWCSGTRYRLRPPKLALP